MAPRPSHQVPALGVLEHLNLKIVNFRLTLRGILTAFWRYPSYRHIWPLKRILAVTYLKAARSLSPRRRLYTSPPTGQAIATWATGSGIQHRSTSVTLSDPAYPAFPLHELNFDSARESKALGGLHLFYVHGGGFAFPIRAAAHLPMIQRLAEASGASTVYLPEYTLAPAVRYPTQHVQIVEAIRLVLQSVPANRLIIAGDSAGGNLVAAVLAHVQKPSPYTPALSLDTPFAGALLICPYVRFHREDALPRSFRENAAHDYLTRAADIRFQGWYNPVYGEVYAEPAVAGADFWRGLPLKRIMIVAGGYEIIRDDILDFGNRLLSGTGREVDVQVVVAVHAVHVEAAVDAAINIYDGSMMGLLLHWCEKTPKLSREN